jgi:hypothetical protein
LAYLSASASRARVEAAELIFHLVDLVAAPLEYGLRLILLLNRP